MAQDYLDARQEVLQVVAVERAFGLGLAASIATIALAALVLYLIFKRKDWL